MFAEENKNLLLYLILVLHYFYKHYRYKNYMNNVYKSNTERKLNINLLNVKYGYRDMFLLAVSFSRHSARLCYAQIRAVIK